VIMVYLRFVSLVTVCKLDICIYSFNACDWNALVGVRGSEIKLLLPAYSCSLQSQAMDII
jgi:hypothetical protein